MNVGLSVILPLIKLHVANVPDFLIMRVLRLAVQQFCQESDYWQIEDTIALDGSASITLPMDSEVLPCRVVGVYYDGEKLEPSTHYRERRRGEIEWLINPPQGEIIVLQSVRPTHDSDEIDEELYSYYGEALAAGAIERLVKMPNKDWSDRQMALSFGDDFIGGYRKAKRERLDDNAKYSTKKIKYQFY